MQVRIFGFQKEVKAGGRHRLSNFQAEDVVGRDSQFSGSRRQVRIVCFQAGAKVGGRKGYLHF